MEHENYLFFFLFFLTVQFCCARVCCLNLLGGDSIYGASSPRMSTGVSWWLSSQLGTSALSLQVTWALSTAALLQFVFCLPGSVCFGGRSKAQLCGPGGLSAPVVHTTQRCCQEKGALYINYRVREEVKLHSRI